MVKIKDCEIAYKLEKRGDFFCDTDELDWLANHIQTRHPAEWPTCRLNKERSQNEIR